MLTGATGFIGSHLQRAFASAKAPVKLTALVRSGTVSRRPELQPDVEQLALDQTSAADWQQAIENARPNAIILLAGTVRGRDYSDFEPANVLPPRALAKALQRLHDQADCASSLPRLLLVSSLAASQPQLSHYAASKRAGETELTNCPTEWTVLRPPAVYGPGDKELAGLFRTIRRGLLPRPGPSDQRVAFLHATDLTAAILAWLDSRDLPAGQTYNIHDGTTDAYGWADIASALRPERKPFNLPVPTWLLHGAGSVNLLLARILRYQPMLTPGKARELGYPRWLCDNSAFSNATGWQPSIRLAEGSACYFNSSE